MGARLLAFLAPESDAPLIETPVEPYAGAERTEQNGVVWQDAALRQLRAARHTIDVHEPDRIIMFGGDCLVNQAPFSYLRERHKGRLGLLRIDARPDITIPKDWSRDNGSDHVAIHVDLDVLAPKLFHSLLLMNPGVEPFATGR